MTQISRSEFLTSVAANQLTGTDTETQQTPENKFANKEIPHFGAKSNTGLNQYSGAFGEAQLIHLLRRCLFGVSQADMDYFNGMTLDQVVTALLTPAATPAPPINEYNNSNFTDPDVALGQTWINAASGTGADALRRKSLKSWWIGLMLNQDRSLTEKMTLFWHQNIATQMSIIQNANYCYFHHAMLRANALGNYKTLIRAVTTDPGMLVYLNGDTNTKNNPNENYGRELQELFTVGKGPDSLYTQADVEAAAKVLTGWKDNRSTNTSYFNTNTHDTTDKQFSAFYSNTIITGQSGTNGANETDQLIDMIFNQTEAAKFLCRKLYRWFIYYVIDDTIEANIITPLADVLVHNNFEMVPTLSVLLKSEHFFDTENVGCVIKNPVDHLIGTLRQFNVVFPTDAASQYKAWNIVASALALLAMDPGDPPNVAGWPAYYQEPQYHEIWINSDTLPTRNEYTDGLSSANGIHQSGITLQFDFIAFTETLSDPRDPNQLIADAAFLLSPNDLGATQTAFLKSILLSGQTNDAYWTTAWDNYIGDTGNTTYLNIVLTRLRSLYSYMLDLAEYQLI
ncbi:MAG TPA: DUF1800 domain-containing protein [Chitinophagales bacterium]|nr:DUF1800 domain-containing protein [Chitinophagales bacterium]